MHITAVCSIVGSWVYITAVCSIEGFWVHITAVCSIVGSWVNITAVCSIVGSWVNITAVCQQCASSMQCTGSRVPIQGTPVCTRQTPETRLVAHRCTGHTLHCGVGSQSPTCSSVELDTVSGLFHPQSRPPVYCFT